MSVCSAADYGWQRVKSVNGTNVKDHTYLGEEQNSKMCYSQSVNVNFLFFDRVCLLTERFLLPKK